MCNLCSPFKGLCFQQREFHSLGCKIPCRFFLHGIIQKRFSMVKMHFFFPLLSRSYFPIEAAHMDLLYFLQEIWALFHVKLMAAVRSVWHLHPTLCSTLHASAPAVLLLFPAPNSIPWRGLCLHITQMGDVNQAVNNPNFLMGTKKYW